MNPIISIGIQIVQALQAFSPALDGAMKFFSFLGTIEFYLLLVPLIYWAVDARLGFRLLLVLISTDLLKNIFKQLLHQPRPYWLGGVKTLAVEPSYGLPSGHASNTLAVWGFLASRLQQVWIWALALFLILMIGLSRVYLGVHFPTDVLGGWLLGMIVLYTFSRIENWVVSSLKKLSLNAQIATFFVASLLILVAAWIVQLLIASAIDPPEWAQFAMQARSITDFFTLAGGLFGATTGYVLMRRSACFVVQSPAWQKAARYLLGIALTLAIYLGLDMLFAMLAADETALGLILRYIRYASVTFWIACGAPWMFLKLKLADRRLSLG